MANDPSRANTDGTAGSGAEFKTPEFYFETDCSAEDINAAKYKIVAGRTGEYWKLTADSTGDLGKHDRQLAGNKQPNMEPLYQPRASVSLEIYRRIFNKRSILALISVVRVEGKISVGYKKFVFEIYLDVINVVVKNPKVSFVSLALVFGYLYSLGLQIALEESLIKGLEPLLEHRVGRMAYETGISSEP
ncbi:hypothetical protein CC86DRAFT_380782 [Ophiobolus disseminans]|uniref:Uncharacterized protein n=1 Tax=Ophiobolus disseminans TaxID=1469910 RepID=A0A6A7A3A3_9PLEO|nr:hypothetical protein CC86DRAFT_380782 [Ophiobolus disseminans]